MSTDGLKAVLKSLPQLESLCLANVKKITRLHIDSSGLRKLRLRDCNLLQVIPYIIIDLTHAHDLHTLKKQNIMICSSQLETLVLKRVDRVRAIKLATECPHLQLLDLSHMPLLTTQCILAAINMTPNLRGLDVSNTALDIRTLNRLMGLLPQLVALAANGIGWELQEEGDKESETSEKVKGSEEEAIVFSSQILEVFWLMDYHEPINNLIVEV